ncbi:hypothetical protein B0H17DRAFT_1140799 [Mycena rosella]|uniref:Uncharacterized protein n=1 Tax=Mycena rosella TaxID=1033263 RepID=A0AAD7GBJ7_MYCRO|nr:hypothetical protein B0H17DRAFT_1140799 [Mycena rosella]
MTTPSRGSPPNLTPLDSPTVGDIQQCLGGLSSCPLLVNTITSTKTKYGIDETDTTRNYLEDSHWVVKGMPFGCLEMFTMLVEASLLPQSAQQKMGPTLCALVFMAESIDTILVEDITDSCGVSIGDTVAPVIEEVVKSQEDLQKVVTEVQDGSNAAVLGGVGHGRKGGDHGGNGSSSFDVNEPMHIWP